MEFTLICDILAALLCKIFTRIPVKSHLWVHCFQAILQNSAVILSVTFVFCMCIFIVSKFKLAKTWNLHVLPERQCWWPAFPICSIETTVTFCHRIIVNILQWKFIFTSIEIAHFKIYKCFIFGMRPSFTWSILLPYCKYVLPEPMSIPHRYFINNKFNKNGFESGFYFHSS